MIEPLESERRCRRRGPNAGSGADGADTGERDAGLPLERHRILGAELRRKRGEQLEVLATLRGELLRGNSDAARFLQAGGGGTARHRPRARPRPRTLPRDARVAAESIAQVEHRPRAGQREPAPGIDARERMRERDPRIRSRLAAPRPGLECSPRATKSARHPQAIAGARAGAGDGCVVQPSTVMVAIHAGPRDRSPPATSASTAAAAAPMPSINASEVFIAGRRRDHDSGEHCGRGGALRGEIGQC